MTRTGSKPDYGVDAPGIIRIFLANAAGLLVAVIVIATAGAGHSWTLPLITLAATVFALVPLGLGLTARISACGTE